MEMHLPAALVFDMDGVLVDSNPFHLQKWVELLNEHHIPFNPSDLPRTILGQRNDTALRFYFGPASSDEECRRLSEALEARFRSAFAPHAKPLPGLARLIAECDAVGIPMAVASSATAKNIEFIVDALGFRRYFRYLISGDEVTRPKPDPEIYLAAAQRLGVTPESCVAFEDSPVGIESAKRAGMKCVGIASTFPADQLRTETKAERVVASFEELSLPALRQLWNTTHSLPARPQRGDA
jgi:beta-phosphoglucomutase